MSNNEKKQGVELDFGTFLKTLSGRTMQEQIEPEEGQRLTEENIQFRPLTIGSYLSNLLWSSAAEKSGTVDQASLSLKIRKADLEHTPIVLKPEEYVLIKELVTKIQQITPGVKRQVLFFLEGKDPFSID